MRLIDAKLRCSCSSHARLMEASLTLFSNVRDCDFHLDIRLDRDRGDLIHYIRRGVQVDQAFVNSHLPSVERVGALTTWRLPNAQLQNLSRQAHRTCDTELLGASTLKQVATHLLESLDILARQSDADAMESLLVRLHRLHRFRRHGSDREYWFGKRSSFEALTAWSL